MTLLYIPQMAYHYCQCSGQPFDVVHCLDGFDLPSIVTLISHCCLLPAGCMILMAAQISVRILFVENYIFLVFTYYFSSLNLLFLTLLLVLKFNITSFEKHSLILPNLFAHRFCQYFQSFFHLSEFVILHLFSDSWVIP